MSHSLQRQMNHESSLLRDLRDKKFLNENDKVSPWIERKIDDSTRAEIVSLTDFLTSETSLKHRIFCLLRGIKSQPVCFECGKPVSVNDGKKSFKEFCSIECVNSSDDVKRRRASTNLIRYGSESSFASISEEDRIKNSRRAQAASVASVVNRYGVSNVMHLKEVRERHLEKMNSIETKEKRTNSLRESCLISHGVRHFSQRSILNYDRYDDREFIVKNFVENEKFLFREFLDFFNIAFSTGDARKHELGIDYPNVNDWKYGKKQREVFDFVRSIYSGKIVQNDRSIISPLELDLVIPEHKLAIELNGLYWHSNLKDSNYHLKKTLACEEKGFQLFHVFENEWDDPIKREIWCSMISNRLNASRVKIGARNCEIREVPFEMSRDFLNENHAQGWSAASIRLGLFHEDRLVSIMTLVKSRFDKSFDYEIARFCNEKFTSVIGAFSRLLAHLLKRNSRIKSLLSYANRRWTSVNDNVYLTNGAELVSVSGPNYFYFKKNKLHSRIEFQKHKLKDILNDFDESLSERQNVINNGYREIHDSGNLKYKFNVYLNN